MDYTKLPITIKEARKKLGKEYESFSDDQIRELLQTLRLLAKNEFMYNSSKKAHGIKHET